MKDANKSRKDAIILKCLDCCAGQRGEVYKCELTHCPLWQWRTGIHETARQARAEKRKAKQEAGT